MNNYTMKKDRVGIDESFPYPIKLEYDDENIYLTVLRIPTLNELRKTNSFAKLAREDYEEFNFKDRLWLVLEQKNLHRGKKFMGKRDKFFASVNLTNNFIEGTYINVGETYTFRINQSITGLPIRLLENPKQDYLEIDPYVIVRGTFRYGAKSCLHEYAGRTEWYSNEAKVFLKND